MYTKRCKLEKPVSIIVSKSDFHKLSKSDFDNFGFKLVTFSIASIFFLNTICSSLDLSYDTPGTNNTKLAPSSIFQKAYPIEGSDEFRRSIISDTRLLAVCLLIAKYLIIDEKDKTGLTKYLRDRFRNEPENVKLATELAQNANFGRNKKEERIVALIPYKRKDQEYIIKVYNKNKLRYVKKKNTDWGVFDEYGRFKDFGGFGIQVITVDRTKPAITATDSHDMRGRYAAEDTDEIIKKLIYNEDEEMLEIYLEDDTLKARRIKWVEGYIPGVTPKGAYLEENDVDINEFFQETQIENIKQFIRKHPVEREEGENSIRGNLVRFRSVRDKTTLRWKDDVDHSNIAHTGIKDRAIYMDEYLLRHIFTEGNEALREEILNNHELKRFKGVDLKPEDAEYIARLALIKPHVEKLEKISQAMLNDDWKFLLGELRASLEEKTTAHLFGLLTICNHVSLSQPRWPVESRYPILRAVTLLPKEEQDKLVEILNRRENRHLHRELVVVDSILLMLDREIPKDWLTAWAPRLRGRSIWQVASEIWNPIGGLGRVMQYHGREINELLKDTNVKLRHIEPFYNLKRDKDGSLVPLEYSSLPIPLMDFNLVHEFEVKVGKRRAKASCYRAENPFGVETYLIRGDKIKDGEDEGEADEDRAWYYTKLPYNYRSSDNPEADNPATWEEFSEFFSRASLELVRFIEERDRKRSKKGWKPPLIHTNDAQVALFDLFRKTMPADGNVLENATIGFSTHTYLHRKTYDFEAGKRVLGELWNIPEEYWEHYFHHRIKGWKYVFDVSSCGARTADRAWGVSRRHVEDVAEFDVWKGVDLIAVTNGDYRAFTARKFRDVMIHLFPNADIECPTAKEVFETKREAKRRAELNPDLPVVSYSGRLVEEKTGSKRAFTDHNIEKLVEMGVQVVIYGNVQSGDKKSIAIARNLRELEATLQGKGYMGKFIFRDTFDLNNQHALLAATDIQVQDSDESTEAAGYSEANISVCGGLQCAPPWREGILQAQGIKINLDVPGEGNTIIPDNIPASIPEGKVDLRDAMYAENYLKNLQDVLRKWHKNPEKFAEYQATSVRLSRVIDARLTAAEYLRQYDRTIAKKEREIEETQKKKETPSPKGTIAAGLKTFYKHFGISNATFAQFKTARIADGDELSDSSYHKELNMLKKLDIITSRKEERSYIYKLWDDISGLRKVERDKLISEIAALPALQHSKIGDLTQVRMEVNRIIKRYTKENVHPERVLLEKVEQDMTAINEIDRNLIPPVEDGKILWHVIPIELIPRSMMKRDFVRRINDMQDKIPGLKEKIRFVNQRNLTSIVHTLTSYDNNIVDVAVNDEIDLKTLPEGVKALLFEGETGDYKSFKQLEFIIAALRALHRNDAKTLIGLYNIISDEPFSGREENIIANVNNPFELVKYLKYKLAPITIHNHERLKELNERLLQFIHSA